MTAAHTCKKWDEKCCIAIQKCDTNKEGGKQRLFDLHKLISEFVAELLPNLSPERRQFIDNEWAEVQMKSRKLNTPRTWRMPLYVFLMQCFHCASYSCARIAALRELIVLAKADEYLDKSLGPDKCRESVASRTTDSDKSTSTISKEPASTPKKTLTYPDVSLSSKAPRNEMPYFVNSNVMLPPIRIESQSETESASSSSSSDSDSASDDDSKHAEAPIAQGSQNRENVNRRFFVRDSEIVFPEDVYAVIRKRILDGLSPDLGNQNSIHVCATKHHSLELCTCQVFMNAKLLRTQSAGVIMAHRQRVRNSLVS